MPTAFEFEQCASWFEEQAATMTGVMGTAMEYATPETLRGGQLAVTVDLALRASHENSMEVAGRYRALAEICLERAEECRAYSAAMDDYDRQYSAYQDELELFNTYGEGSPRSPARPPAPPPYVERS